jgi:hypothetical protein
MTVYKNEGRYDTSNVVFKDGRIIKYSKNATSPDMDFIDYGLGILRKSVFDGCELENIDLANIYERECDSGRLAGYEVFHRFYEIGSLAGMAELENIL